MWDLIVSVPIIAYLFTLKQQNARNRRRENAAVSDSPPEVACGKGVTSAQ